MGISRTSLTHSRVVKAPATSMWSGSTSQRLASMDTGSSVFRALSYRVYRHDDVAFIATHSERATLAERYSRQIRKEAAWIAHPITLSTGNLFRVTRASRAYQHGAGDSRPHTRGHFPILRDSNWTGKSFRWGTETSIPAPPRLIRGSAGLVQLRASAQSEESERKPSWYKAIIRGNTTVAEELHLLECAVPMEIAQTYQIPGQYVMLRRDATQEKPGFFAITSPPKFACHGTDCFEFLVKRVDATEWLCSSTPGSVVDLTAAQGHGFPIHERLCDSVRHVLLFATGSGIAPIRASIEDADLLTRMDSIKLYYGCRNQRRMAFQDRFARWQQERGVQVVPVLSQPAPSWTGARGYVQHVLELDGIQTRPEDTAVLLCGLRGMTTAVETYLLRHGFEKQHILYNF
ncbi:hypothetical protein F1559_001908 [Cyanidiococcus yangmingshanensis]|uniref:FAD-binding FR-type domain-containing protein n=1 Tax=Cyanidiococcus yangmingshanensis TaxID=2690220 RepID=A0A7J7IHZ0_9RHOD|nr:hypothetical protein F1559_001908 [Cyanidiococcus yangmingshanensis]